MVQEFNVNKLTPNLHWNITQVCNYKCSYCTIPIARGPSRSDNIKNLVDKARKRKGPQKYNYSPSQIIVFTKFEHCHPRCIYC